VTSVCEATPTEIVDVEFPEFVRKIFEAVGFEIETFQVYQIA
jgi:hypothetical protein